MVYPGVSPSFIRWLIAEGKLPRVELPSTTRDAAKARRLLIDKADRDRLIEQSKSGEVHCQRPRRDARLSEGSIRLDGAMPNPPAAVLRHPNAA